MNTGFKLININITVLLARQFFPLVPCLLHTWAYASLSLAPMLSLSGITLVFRRNMRKE
jgi:hypothetical protein